jgi:predicted transposase YdaD
LGQHDLSYRLFFSHARMVRDLLREMVGEAWVERIDFTSAERVNTSFVSETLKNRESDVIWKFRRQDTGEAVYVYVLLEFQSRPDRYMPVRLMSYIGLLYQTLIAGSQLPPSGLLPQAIPVVVYNGIGAWGSALELSELIERLDPSAEAYIPRLRYKLIHQADYDAEELGESPVADLFRIERSRDWAEVRLGVSRLREHVGPGDPGLRRAFESWLQQVVLPRLGVTAGEVHPRLTLEEFESMLAERIDEWNREVREEGVRQGVQQGLRQGVQEGRQEGLQLGEAKALLRLLERRFGLLDPRTRDRVTAADADLLLEWIDRAATAESLAAVFADC